MNKGMAVLGGLALGAGLMYVLDPERGRRRRALMNDKLTSWCSHSARATGSKARHLSNRAKGLMHETRSALASAAEAAAGAVGVTGGDMNEAGANAESKQPLTRAATVR